MTTNLPVAALLLAVLVWGVCHGQEEAAPTGQAVTAAAHVDEAGQTLNERGFTDGPGGLNRFVNGLKPAVEEIAGDQAGGIASMGVHSVAKYVTEAVANKWVVGRLFMAYLWGNRHTVDERLGQIAVDYAVPKVPIAGGIYKKYQEVMAADYAAKVVPGPNIVKHHVGGYVDRIAKDQVHAFVAAPVYRQVGGHVNKALGVVAKEAGEALEPHAPETVAAGRAFGAAMKRLLKGPSDEEMEEFYKEHPSKRITDGGGKRERSRNTSSGTVAPTFTIATTIIAGLLCIM
ncbi:Uncharacterized protein PBTT_09953 [Plasmodiophora brassicae]|uniref:Uncharacterized protein n=1 Tax=Plasmodiophora brassicae TaxID=37360 RepID=A0A0G4J118_PLABS|nr:secrectory protein [Plasmodiophora brassicae]CEP01250.1 hypothetical protein PBRA_001856 [Plasmodiophora brassicae]SPR01289.1 unnamed protein product [Plasmodiophora brassicae]